MASGREKLTATPVMGNARFVAIAMRARCVTK